MLSLHQRITLFALQIAKKHFNKYFNFPGLAKLIRCVCMPMMLKSRTHLASDEGDSKPASAYPVIEVTIYTGYFGPQREGQDVFFFLKCQNTLLSM